MASREAAKAAVLRISERFGYLNTEELDEIEKINPSLRAKVERCSLAKDKLLGHAIITLAQNIYGSDARFVFELLQNADDNQFTTAIASGTLPFASFHVYTDRIVVECNEDGFTENDVEAICSVGNSKKSASHGYIGAKGIGFKSVFIAAWKVHIQSGHFSFCFIHRRGDSGVGMVTPIWQDTEEMSENSLTRMTLYLHDLHDTKDKKQLGHLFETIFKQLSDLQETSLLFLRKLKEIKVSFYDENNILKSSRCFRNSSNNNNTVLLETIIETRTPAIVSTSTKQFHITRHMASNLSQSVSRQVPDTQDAMRAAAVAEVVLAFPLSGNLEPVIEKQDFFAFLPVRKSEFSFIIQSDFDTTASRQDIVATSRRNIDLLDAIAVAFVKAVLEFCKHPDLCFTWPEFLPSLKPGSSDFWSGLTTRIRTRLSWTPILQARHGTHLRKIDTLVSLTRDFMDENGEPLLYDSAIAEFLSGAYPSKVVAILRSYGLKNMAVDLLARLLRADLEQPKSRMKSLFTSRSWHSIMAILLSRCAENSRIRSLPILPLTSEEWVSSAEVHVYLPTALGIRVPGDLDIPILDHTAAANTDREAMFKRFGATEPKIADIRNSIDRRYGPFRPSVSLAQSKAHLHFLFLSHLSEPAPTRETYQKIALHTTIKTISPHSEDVYLPTNHPYGARKLLQRGPNLPGFHVPFVDFVYLLVPPDSPSARHPSWEEWLCDSIGVRERPRLVSRNGDALSGTWMYIAIHRPDKLLGLMEYLWKHEGSQVRRNKTLKAQIQETKADELCITLLSKPRTLKETFLPLKALQGHCERFMERGEPFPFLKLEPETSQERLRLKWLFLHEDISVGTEDDTRFYLEVLFWIKQANPNAGAILRHERLLDLYLTIYAKVAASTDRDREKQVVINFINTNECLYVPPSPSQPESPAWTMTGLCIWDGPPYVMCKYSLKAILVSSFGLEKADEVSGFFQQVLRIPDVSCEDLIDDLGALREMKGDFDHVLMLYQRLATISNADERKQSRLRARFAEESLTCVFKGEIAGWYKTGECLWSSTTEIRGKVTLSEDYEDLKDFFLNTLEVKELTLQMVYDELLQTDEQSSIVEIKRAIWSLNALLQSEPGNSDPVPLLRKRILPVALPNGAQTLANSDVDFSIGDREYLIAQFRGRVKMLDYDLAEVRQLTTFLRWAKLSSRFMSESVKEVTSVGHGTVRPVSSANRKLRRKAHALLRIAASFNSPRYAADGPGLYNTLRSINTVATDKILSVSSLFQDGAQITVDSEAGDLHISELDDDFTVYIPLDKDKQDFCFASPLPTNLAAWLMRDPVTQIQEKVDEAMVTALTTIVFAAPSAIDRALDHQGVIQVPIVDEDHENYSDSVSHVSAEGDDDDGTAIVEYARAATDEPSENDYDATDVYTEQARAPNRERDGYRSCRPPLRRFDSDDAYSDTNQYRELLNKVVGAARRAQFPSQGSFDMSALRSVLSDDGAAGYDGFEPTQRFRPRNQLERNFQVGAAGELYVFEIMSRLDPVLRGWSQDNWKSNIRGRVSVHDDYRGMLNWTGRETADLVYDDVSGDMTATLIDRGYLRAEEWRDSRPLYYIEVKTTTGACGVPFYMSDAQYRRMTNVHDAAGQREVYLICRVFEIEHPEQMGMKIYVDPWQLGQEGQLVFTAEGWSVVRGAQ